MKFSSLSCCFILLFAVWVQAQTAKTIRRINFERVKYPISKVLEQEDLSVEKTVFGDLNRDRKEEAAVILRWSYRRIGGNGFGYYVFLYTLKNGKLSLIKKMNGGSKEEHFMVKDIAIKNSRLEIRRCEADQNFNNFSMATIFYRLRNGQLSKVKKKIRLVKEQCYLGD